MDSARREEQRTVDRADGRQRSFGNRIGLTNASATHPKGRNPDDLRRNPQSMSDTARACCSRVSERRACSQATSREPSVTRREQWKTWGQSTDTRRREAHCGRPPSSAGAGGDTAVDGRDRGDKVGGGTSKEGPQHVASGVVGCFGAGAQGLRDHACFDSLFLPSHRPARLTLVRVPDGCNHIDGYLALLPADDAHCTTSIEVGDETAQIVHEFVTRYEIQREGIPYVHQIKSGKRDQIRRVATE
jgi:hypothetical protein